jgi:hypothetical protein
MAATGGAAIVSPPAALVDVTAENPATSSTATATADTAQVDTSAANPAVFIGAAANATVADVTVVAGNAATSVDATATATTAAVGVTAANPAALTVTSTTTTATGALVTVTAANPSGTVTTTAVAHPATATVTATASNPTTALAVVTVPAACAAVRWLAPKASVVFGPDAQINWLGPRAVVEWMTCMKPTDVGDLIQFDVIWTPPEGSSAVVTAAMLHILPPSGIEETAPGVEIAPNHWRFTAASRIDEGGPWRVRVNANAGLIDSIEFSLPINATRFAVPVP